MAAFRKKMQKREIIANPLGRLWPETRPLASNKMMELAEGWRDYGIPEMRDLILLGRPNLEEVHREHLATVADLKQQRRKLRETIERLNDTSAARMRLRMKPDFFCDYAGKEYGRLQPEEIEDLSMKELQDLQSKAARRIERKCRFGPLIADWCPKAPPCSESGTCTSCGRCRNDLSRPTCIFAEVGGNKALKDCIQALEIQLDCLELAIRNLEKYLSEIRLARKQAQAKRPLLPVWRRADFVQTGGQVVILQVDHSDVDRKSTTKLSLATVAELAPAPRNLEVGLRQTIVALTDKGEKLNFLRDSACIMALDEYRFLRKHPDFAELWTNAAPATQSSVVRQALLSALRRSNILETSN